MNLLIRASDLENGHNIIIPDSLKLLEYIHFSSLLLSAENEVYEFFTGDDEFGMDVLSGSCSIDVHFFDGNGKFTFEATRENPFTEPPSMLYLPRETHARFTCLHPPLEALIVGVPSEERQDPVYIPSQNAPRFDFGRNNWSRTVYPSIGPNVQASRLMMGETHTSSGNWSSYPPHKHDDPSADEIPSEEIYHFRFNPPQGFGLQSVWTAPEAQAEPINETYRLQHGDTVIIPRGFHPVVVAPGFEMITVWAFAGKQRAWDSWRSDPLIESLLRGDAPKGR
jgi:5-deoxy-glucuronate isomerase